MANPVCEVEVTKDKSGWGGFARRRPQPPAQPKFISKSLRPQKQQVRFLPHNAKAPSNRVGVPAPKRQGYAGNATGRVLGSPPSSSSQPPPPPPHTSSFSTSQTRTSASSLRASTSSINTNDPVAKRSGGWGASRLSTDDSTRTFDSGHRKRDSHHFDSRHSGNDWGSAGHYNKRPRESDHEVLQREMAHFQQPWESAAHSPAYGKLQLTPEQQEKLLKRRRCNRDCRLGFITVFAHKHSAQTLTSVTLARALKDNNEWQARMDEFGSQMLQLFGDESLEPGENGSQLAVLSGDVAALHFVLNSSQEETGAARHSINRVSFFRGCRIWLAQQPEPMNALGTLIDRSGIDLAFAWLRENGVHQIRKELAEVCIWSDILAFGGSSIIWYQDYNPPFEAKVCPVLTTDDDGAALYLDDLHVNDVCDVLSGSNFAIGDAFWNILQTQYADLPEELLDLPGDELIPRTQNYLFVVCDLGGETLAQAASSTRDEETMQHMLDNWGNVRPMSLEERERQERRQSSAKTDDDGEDKQDFPPLRQVVAICGGPEGFFSGIFESKQIKAALIQRGFPCTILTLCEQDQFTASIQGYFLVSLEANWGHYEMIHRNRIRDMRKKKEVSY